jgi:tripartite-type tricarboxylate transporter receptor subunit TctC
MNSPLTKHQRQRRLSLKATAAAGLVMAGRTDLTFAQTFPTKPIRLLVPFAPGGTSEIVARTLAVEMSSVLGQNVIVENKPGGAGVIAMTEVLKAAPDGHTLVLGHVGTLAVNPYALAKQPYDVNKDFQPVALLARVPNLFVVHPDVPAKNLKEFVALAKSKPGKLNYGSAGNASAGHLAYEYLAMVTGIDLTHIPYRGTGPQMIDLIAGRTETASAGAPALMPYIKDGKVRPIAVGMPKRIAALPDVPTVAEQGYEGFETSQWYGIIAPAAVPKAVIEKLNAAANQALKTRQVGERFSTDNAIFGPGTPEDFGKFIREEQARWELVVKKSNLKLDS